MIYITPHVKIFAGIEPLDFRNGFNGTAAACRIKLNQNPLEGGLFVFINRTRTMIRLYLFDGHGEWIATKRVAKGRFYWWKKEKPPEDIIAEQLYLILRGGKTADNLLPIPWRKIN